MYLGAQDPMTYPCPPRLPPPRGLWLCKASSRKFGRRGCFLAERTALLGRNKACSSGCRGLRLCGVGVVIQPNPPILWGDCRPDERLLPKVNMGAGVGPGHTELASP